MDSILSKQRQLNQVTGERGGGSGSQEASELLT